MSRIAVVAAACAVIVGMGTAAEAATFTVNPTQIYLTGKSASALLTLRNDSQEPLRFQLSAFAWSQGVRGEIELEPTSDVIFFPALLTLKPGEERKVRVGGVTAAGAAEKTYRIFVEELPAVDSTLPGASVKVITKMGVPIFVRPQEERTAVDLSDVDVAAGRVRFAVANQGSVHVVPTSITVRASDGAGASIVEKAVVGWYILAGGRREFDVELPAGDCARIATILIEMKIDDQEAITRTVQAPGGACAQ